MKNDVIISKMINYVEKILKYTDGMKYSEFESKDLVVEACVFNLRQFCGNAAHTIATFAQAEDAFYFDSIGIIQIPEIPFHIGKLSAECSADFLYRVLSAFGKCKILFSGTFAVSPG